MATEGRAGVMIDVIFDEGNVIACLHFSQCIQQQSVPCQIVNDGVPQTHAFRRGVLDVAHIKIKAASIQQKPTVAGWLFVIAIMQVQSARSRVSENVILDACRPGFGRKLGIVDKRTIFGFEADHPIHKANIPH
jgi:hypothetical protein